MRNLPSTIFNPQTDVAFNTWGTRPLENLLAVTDIVYRHVARNVSTLETRIHSWDVNRFRLNVFHVLVQLREQRFEPGYVFVALLYVQRYAGDCRQLPDVSSSEAEKLFMGALATALYQARPLRLPERSLWLYSTPQLQVLCRMWRRKMDLRHLKIHPCLLQTFCDILLAGPGHSIIDGDIFPTFPDAEMLDDLKIPSNIYLELIAEELEISKRIYPPFTTISQIRLPVQRREAAAGTAVNNLSFAPFICRSFEFHFHYILFLGFFNAYEERQVCGRLLVEVHFLSDRVEDLVPLEIMVTSTYEACAAAISVVVAEPLGWWGSRSRMVELAPVSWSKGVVRLYLLSLSRSQWTFMDLPILLLLFSLY
ncbi:hypothetical protein EST38_g3029 [Candolleomyces aberdarensis]|uniref:Uncharacterized protein n=1 Tax=Candolleomyces aberdarensis TaxID=2316362 RepID=A0A4Q2DV69_9AGAR|nr:hypothetical protein EST38_g3029 [Candolleomyces aberdarensis]